MNLENTTNEDTMQHVRNNTLSNKRSGIRSKVVAGKMHVSSRHLSVGNGRVESFSIRAGTCVTET